MKNNNRRRQKRRDFFEDTSSKLGGFLNVPFSLNDEDNNVSQSKAYKIANRHKKKGGFDIIYILRNFFFFFWFYFFFLFSIPLAYLGVVYGIASVSNKSNGVTQFLLGYQDWWLDLHGGILSAFFSLFF